MIKVDALTKWYGLHLAVEEISFTVEPGDVLGFIGPNGAGKSTTMRMIAGFIPATSGSVSIDGHDVAEAPVLAKSRLGYLPENAPLYDNMTVESFLYFCAGMRGLHRREIRETVDKVVKRCFLESVRHQLVDTLSKGYRRRCCLAQSIMHDPAFLLLDEPTDGLDPNQKREVRELIHSMGQTKGIVLSTHILEEVEAVCNRVIVIDNGKKIFDGTPTQMRKQAKACSVFLVVEVGPLSEVKSELASLSRLLTGDPVIEKQDDDLEIHFDCKDSEAQREVCEHLLKFSAEHHWNVRLFSAGEEKLEQAFCEMTRASRAGEGGTP